MTVGGERLEQFWEIAIARPPTTTFRTVAVDVHTGRGPVLVAVDRHGGRVLLVPIAMKQTLQQDLDGHAVVLRRQTLEDDTTYRAFASLELVDPGLGDIFTALCVEILGRISTTPDRPVAVLRKVLDDWRSLLAGKHDVLTPSALAGLFGELLLLREMARCDPGAVAFWTGPTGTGQDFHQGIQALEVKTTTLPEGRRVRIHGIEQLDLAPPGRLVLHWFRLRTGQGTSVPELLDIIRRDADDGPRLQQLLRGIGYEETDREIYSRHRFDAIESQTFVVGTGFPRITPGGLMGDAIVAGVGSVEYIVDLDSPAAQAQRVDIDPVSLFLEVP